MSKTQFFPQLDPDDSAQIFLTISPLANINLSYFLFAQVTKILELSAK